MFFNKTKRQQKEIDDLKAAQQRPIKYLVFSGGGAKGVVYPGAFRAMQNSGVLDGVTKIAGASAGAITAAIIALGTPISKVRDISLHVNMESLMGSRVYNQHPGVIPIVTKDGNDLYGFIQELIQNALMELDIDDLKNKVHAYSATAIGADFIQTAEELIKKLTEKNYDISFADLNVLHQINPKQFKNLTVTAIKLPNGEPQTFDVTQTPNVSVALACRASASIPIVLKPVEIELNGKKELYIDGGIENNLPTNLISDPLHLEDTLVFAFGEGDKAGSKYRQNRIEYAMHHGHWSEAITLDFLKNIYTEAFNKAQQKNNNSMPTKQDAKAMISLVLKRMQEDALLNRAVARELKYYLTSTLNSGKTTEPGELAVQCYERIKQGAPKVYEPGFLERLAQNILPAFLIGLITNYKSTDKKYEDFRRVREEFPLRTVNLHVGPIGTIDFKKATQLARTMDAIGYADTMGHILNHDLGNAANLDTYYAEVNKNFEIIYRALLVSSGKYPEKDSLLKQLQQERSDNNRFEAIKSYVVSHASSHIAFAFTRAIEYQDGLIDKDILLKETYLESFKYKLIAVSHFGGETFYRTSSLEAKINSNPESIHALVTKEQKALPGTRMEKIVAELSQLHEASEAKLTL